jgi:predicted RND superfamily exporter protein
MSAIPSEHIERAGTTRLTALGIEKPRFTLSICLLVALLFAAAFPLVQVDTNPKNMLPLTSDVRVWNTDVEQRFGLHEDTIVVAIKPANGVLNVDSLQKLAQFTATTLALPGIVKGDVTSLYTVDNVTATQDSLRIAPLLSTAPTSQDQVDELRRQLFEGPLFIDRLISADGLTTALYVPLQPGANGAELAEKIRNAAVQTFSQEEIYVTGDPVARDLFGAEMFKLMALFAPFAGALMMGLMYWMFRSWWLAGVMMLTAMVSIMISLGASIALGFPLHIMSSMAPVFLMAIATDSIHIFNEFFQRYRPHLNRAEVVRETIQAVARPVRYTALATALGFAVLLFMTIVPVKVFGGIIVLGTVVLRILSFYLIPACLMLVPLPKAQPAGSDALSRLLNWIAGWAVRRSGRIITVSVLLALFAAVGASHLVVDNNMLRWFKEGSEVRRADSLFNQVLGGAMPASVVIDTGRADGVKDPAVLAAIETIQSDLKAQGLIGTSLSVVDYLKRINRVLTTNDATGEVLPRAPDMVGQYLLAFSMGARPSDLNRVIDYEAQRANILLQLKSGDAQLMQSVETRIQTLIREQQMPFTAAAAGPAHFNLVWNGQVLQDMILGFLIALGVVFVVLVLDFRSIAWALVAYVPLLLTVGLIVGVLGWAGKSVDMPIAVLSCLSLGMAVDFAIHFVTRYRQRCAQVATEHSCTDAQRSDLLQWVIQWPGKGILRNALMFAVAFAVMLAAPLTPYITVGAFIVAMMTISALASITLLPALIKAFRL